MGIRTELTTAIRIIAFRATHEELRNLGYSDLALGLLLTWLVGVCRWWEDPGASLSLRLGVGSVVYVFALSLLLWAIIWPVSRNARPSYRNVLTFICLTAPPAFLYAVPVRTLYDLPTSQQFRVWCLAIISIWRVALLAFYLIRRVRLSYISAANVTLFPLTIIVVTLSILNLERVVLNIMGGIDPANITVNDEAYSVLIFLSLLSFLFFIPLFIIYAVIAVRSNKALIILLAFFIIAIVILVDTGHFGFQKFLFAFDYFPYGDKFEHFNLYGILSFLVNLTALRSFLKQYPRRVVVVATLLLALVIGINSDWKNLMSSYLGVALGAWLAYRI
jgi:hypothetical protein